MKLPKTKNTKSLCEAFFLKKERFLLKCQHAGEVYTSGDNRTVNTGLKTLTITHIC